MSPQMIRIHQFHVPIQVDLVYCNDMHHRQVVVHTKYHKYFAFERQFQVPALWVFVSSILSVKALQEILLTMSSVHVLQLFPSSTTHLEYPLIVTNVSTGFRSSLSELGASLSVFRSLSGYQPSSCLERSVMLQDQAEELM